MPVLKPKYDRIETLNCALTRKYQDQTILLTISCKIVSDCMLLV